MATNLEAGIAAGCMLATLWFAVCYARVRARRRGGRLGSQRVRPLRHRSSNAVLCCCSADKAPLLRLPTALHTCLQSQLSSLAPVPGRSRIVRGADQEAALELLRPTHLASVQLRGWQWFGTAASVSRRLHEAAQGLESAGLGGASGTSLAAAGAQATASQRHADRLYADSSKHGGALHAAVAAPRFMLLDLSATKGLDATAARTLAALCRRVGSAAVLGGSTVLGHMAACWLVLAQRLTSLPMPSLPAACTTSRDLAQLDITPIVTAAGHSGIRQLLLAHGAPLPHAPAATAEEATAALAAAAAAAAEEAAEGEGGAVGPPPPCFEFTSREEGLRYAEKELLAVACRYGLCRPASEAVPLADMLASHAGCAGGHAMGGVKDFSCSTVRDVTSPHQTAPTPTHHPSPSPLPTLQPSGPAVCPQRGGGRRGGPDPAIRHQAAAPQRRPAMGGGRSGGRPVYH